MKNVTRNIKFILLGMIGAFGSQHASGQSKKALNPPVNTAKFIETAPTVSADGRTMIFESNRQGEWKLFETRRKGNVWSVPTPIPKISATFYENQPLGAPCLSYDGNVLYFSAESKESSGHEDIFVSVKESTGWSSPTRLPNTINTTDYEGYPSLSPDGQKLYFARAKYNEKNTQDAQSCYRIMVSEKAIDGSWKTPVELPSPINLLCEKAPRIMPDGKTLVFASVRKEGKGNFDLYYSTLQSNNSWSPVKPLTEVNTPQADLFAAIPACGQELFFVENNDIYTTQVSLFANQTIIGTITDSLTNKPLSTRINIFDKNKGNSLIASFLSNTEGNYTAIVPAKGNYSFEIKEAGYYEKRLGLDLSNQSSCEASVEPIRLVMLANQAKVEPTPAKIPANIPQLKLAFQVVDSKTRFLVPAQVEILEKGSGKAIATQQQGATGQIASAVALGQEYELVVNAKGYNPVRQPLKYDNQKDAKPLTQIALEATTTNLSIRALDASTNQPAPNWKVILTENGTGTTAQFAPQTGTNLVQLYVPENRQIKVSIQSDYFEDNDLNITSQSTNDLTVKLIPRKVTLIRLKAVDDITQGILYASFKVKTKKKGEVLEGKTNKDNEFFEIKLLKDDVLEISAEADGYLPFEKTLEFPDFKLGEKKIELIAMQNDRYPMTVKIVDGDTKQIIKTSKVKIADMLTGEVNPTTQGNAGEFKAMMKRKGSFEVVASAEGYRPLSQKIEDIPVGATLTFTLYRNKSVPVSFTVLDAKTNKPVEANLTVKLEKSNRVETFQGQSEVEIRISEKEVFTVESSAPTFKHKQSTFNMADLLENKKYNYIIRLEKEYVQVAIKVVDNATGTKVDVQKYALYDLSDKSAKPEVVIANDGSPSMSILPENKYRIELVAAGFERFSQEIINFSGTELVCKMTRVASDMTVALTAKDSISQKPLEAIFKVTKADGSVVSQGLTLSGKMEFKFIIPAFGTYYVETVVKGYSVKKEKISIPDLSANRSFSVYFSRDFSVLTARPVHAETRDLLKDALVIMTDLQTNKMVSAMVTLPNGEVSANLTPGHTYKMKVKAAGFEEYETQIQATSDDQRKDLELQPFKKYLIQLYAIDAVKKSRVPASIKISAPGGGTIAEGSTDTRNEYVLASLMDKVNYTIEVKADGYKLYDGRFTLDESMKKDKDKTAIWLEKETILSFSVIDAKYKNIVNNVTAHLTDLKSSQELALSLKNDIFSAELSPVASYQLEIQAEGYMPYSAKIEPSSVVNKKEILLSRTKENTQIPTVVAKAEAPAAKNAPDVVQKIEKGKSFVLNNVYFEQGSFILQKESYPELDKVVTMLKQNPQTKIEIAGHTDNVGDPRLNKALSENRARVILNYFVSKGIDDKRLTFRGYGGTQPVAPNDNEDSKKRNRRVEIVGIQ